MTSKLLLAKPPPASSSESRRLLFFPREQEVASALPRPPIFFPREQEADVVSSKQAPRRRAEISGDDEELALEVALEAAVTTESTIRRPRR
jgi:hypothetical protein